MTDEPVLVHTMPRVLLVDAKAAGVLLGVPATWLLAEARRDRVPHVRLGRYVRFDPVSLADWSARRERGAVGQRLNFSDRKTT